MSSLRGVVRQSILTEAIPSEAAARRTELNDVPNPLKRGVLKGIHRVATRYPERLSPYAGLGVRDRSAVPLAAGLDAQVYRVGDMVAKVHKTGVNVAVTQQQEILAQKRHLFAILQHHLPELTLPQTTDITSHPAYPDISAVVTWQPFQQAFRDAALFKDDNSIDHEAMATLQGTQLLPQLAGLVDGSLRMYRATGVVPDLWGESNLVFTENSSRLTMIDGQPLNTAADSDRESGAVSVERLHNLTAALLEVA